MKEERSLWNSLITVCMVAFLCLGMAGMTGCEDATDDESDVRVSNYDNHDYTVRLYQADNTLVGELVIEEGDSRDFDGVDEGLYYINIYRVGETTVRDRSATFFIEDEEDVSFSISGSGNIN